MEHKKNLDPESMLKGRMAETLVEDLLKGSGNKVYRFGYEAILQNLTQIQKVFAGYTDTGMRIRAIPDFIIIDVNGNPIFLEVKFRWNGEPGEADRERFKRIGDLWNAKVIIVNRIQKPYFLIVNPPYLDAKGKFDCTPLLEEKSWKIDKTLYEQFEKLVEKYLTPTLVSDKDIGLNDE